VLLSSFISLSMIKLPASFGHVHSSNHLVKSRSLSDAGGRSTVEC
jgi:hypothetical protein